MKLEVVFSPKNSLILLMDHASGEPPADIDGLVATTSSCVAVGTLSEYDGETRVLLSDLHLANEGVVAFEGEILTPRKEISVCGTDNTQLLTLPTGSEKTRLKIFVNDEHEPDQISIWVFSPESRP